MSRKTVGVTVRRTLNSSVKHVPKELGSQNFTLMNFRGTCRRPLFNNKLSVQYLPLNLIFLCFRPLVYGWYLESVLFPCVVEWSPCDTHIFATFAVNSADTGILLCSGGLLEASQVSAESFGERLEIHCVRFTSCPRYSETPSFAQYLCP